jgi:hypothetical protein
MSSVLICILFQSCEALFETPCISYGSSYRRLAHCKTSKQEDAYQIHSHTAVLRVGFEAIAQVL